MSAALENARQRIANRDYNRALDSLNIVRRQASSDNLEEVRELLEVATLLQTHGGARVQRHCAAITAEAQALLRGAGETDIATTLTPEGSTPPPPPPSHGTAAASPPAPPSAQRPQYPTLRILRVVNLILGWIVLVGGTIGVIYLGSNTSSNYYGEQTSALSGADVAVLLVAVALYSLTLFAGASFITLFLRVEANSNETIELLRRGGGNN